VVVYLTRKLLIVTIQDREVSARVGEEPDTLLRILPRTHREAVMAKVRASPTVLEHGVAVSLATNYVLLVPSLEMLSTVRDFWAATTIGRLSATKVS
jgi:hypothetical protein